MKYIITFILLTLNISLFAQHEHKVVFKEGKVQELKDQAIAKSRVILALVVDSTSFGQEVDPIVFSDTKVIDLISSRFLTLKVTKGENDFDLFGKKYNISSYPSYIFIDPNSGEMLYKIIDKFTRDDFLNAAAKALDEQNNFVSWKRRYEEENDYAIDFLFTYAKELQIAGEDYYPIADKYLKAIGGNFLQYPNGLEAILRFVDDLNDYRFLILLQSWQQVDKSKYPHMFVDNRILEIVSTGVAQMKMTDSTINISDTVHGIAEIYGLDMPEMVNGLAYIKYCQYTGKRDNDYYRHLLNYITANYFRINEKQMYAWLLEFVNSNTDEELNREAAGIAMEAIAHNNRVEYQEIIIKIHTHINEFEEANHALEVLEMMNENEKVYSPEKIDELRGYINGYAKKFNVEGRKQRR
jgi:autonomous glycyl radical cofactor GrcA